MFKVNYLKDYYNLSKEEFGTTDDYTQGKTDIDFLCMLREKISTSIDKTNNEITLNGRKISLNDLKMHLQNEITINENNSKYNSMSLKILLITIFFNGLFQLLPKDEYVISKIVIFISMIVGAVIIFPIIDFFASYIYKTNTSIVGFYKISLDILNQVLK